MLGFAPLGSVPLGSIPGAILRLTSDILQEIVTRFVDDERLLPGRPVELHHFTSLEISYQIIEADDVRLSHAEYSNDQTEMERAKQLIVNRLGVCAPTDGFFGDVLAEYQRLAPSLDAFILCMSTGLPSGGTCPQDMLSQWRAYGQDGRGVCLTFEASKLSRLVENTPGLRLNPVIYDPTTQLRFVDAILDRALAAAQSGKPNAREAAVAALVYATPLIKDAGFTEEQEWRLIFMPPSDVKPHLKFHARRDFLAPFVTLADVWFKLCPSMLQIPEIAAMLPTIRPMAHVPPLMPITKIMIGPSGHQLLSRRAALKLLAQTPHRGTVQVLTSSIPYRSLA
jgi:hypothetical protein